MRRRAASIRAKSGDKCGREPSPGGTLQGAATIDASPTHHSADATPVLGPAHSTRCWPTPEKIISLRLPVDSGLALAWASEPSKSHVVRP